MCININVKDLLNKKLSLVPHSFTDNSGIELPGIYNFWGSDTKELYESNLKLQNSDWHYRTKDVEYDLNSAGYRCPEFNTIDWENSIVIHGCSQVFGVGLAEDETITGQLQQFTNRQVINLGKNGASMIFSLVNNILLENNFPKPFAVINHWTSTWRDTIFGTEYPYHISGPTLVKQYYKTHLRMLETLGISFDDVSNDFTFKAQMMSHLCKILWRDTNYIETTWMDTTADDLNCYEQKFLDIARDTQKRKGKEQGIRVAPKSVIALEDHGHGGVKTAKQLAEYYAELLK